MQNFKEYLEEKFRKDEILLFIIDSNGDLRNILDLINFKESISLFNKIYKIKLFKSNKSKNFRLFVENEIRDKEINQNYLIILSKVGKGLPYYEDLSKKVNTMDFSLQEYVKNSFGINVEDEIINDPIINLNYFVDHHLEILKYKMEQIGDLSEDYKIENKDQFRDLKRFINNFDKKNYTKIPKKPLFVVDMTFFEFKHILTLLKEVNDNIDRKFQYLSGSDIIRKRRELLKQKIIEMFGEIKIDRNKRPRNISDANKPKFAGNYMITLSQLNLLEDNKKFNKIYNLIKNKEEFIKKIRELLLIEGKWSDYIEAIKKVNQLNNISNKKKYRDNISHILFRKYHKYYPDLKKYRWKKQFRYVTRWLLDEELKILKEKPGKICYEILYPQKLEGPGQGIEGKIFIHKFLKDKNCWVLKEYEN